MSLYTAVSGAIATVGVPCNSVIVQNSNSSTPIVLLGDVNGQFYELTPGQAVQVPCNNLNQLYVKAASSTATVNLIWMLQLS